MVIPKVVEDARVEVDGKSARPRLVWMAVGFIIGAGFAVISLLGNTQLPPAQSTFLESEVTISRGGITDELPGFPDGLIAASRTEGQSLELVVWPLMGKPYESGIPVGVSSPPDPVEFDVSGHLLATVLPVRGEAAGVLYAGVPDAAGIVSLNVTGYAWHDSLPESLAYTKAIDDGETMLSVTAGNLASSDLVARAMGMEGGVAAWGDWGYAVQDGENIVLFTDTGEISNSVSGRVLDSHSTGWLAVDDQGVALLSASGDVREIGDTSASPILAASFSPDGTLLALLSVEGLQIVSLDQAVVRNSASERPGVAQIVWSSDGQYALYPGVRGVIVLNSNDGTVHELMPTGIFTGLAVLNSDGP